MVKDFGPFTSINAPVDRAALKLLIAGTVLSSCLGGFASAPLLALPDLTKARTQFENGSWDETLQTLGTAKDFQSCFLRGQINDILGPPLDQQLVYTWQDNPEDARALAFAGYINSHWKECHQTAFELLKKSLKIDPKNADTHSIFGRFLFKTGKKAEGMQEMLYARSLAPQSFLVLHNLADTYIDELSPDKALEQLNSLVQYHPTMPLAYFYRARYFEDRGQVVKAMADYDHALQINRRFRLAAAFKAAFLLRRGESEQAAAAATIALPPSTQNRRDSIIDKALKTRAIAEIALHQDEKAVADLNRIIGKQSQFTGQKLQSDTIKDLVLERAKAYERLGDWSRADKDLTILQSQGKTGSEIEFLKAKLLEDKNQPTAALLRYNKLINSGLPAPEFYRGRARVYTKLGKTNLAEADLKKAQNLETPHF